MDLQKLYQEPVEIDAGPDLVVHNLIGSSNRLVLSLAGVGPRRSGTPPIEFIGSASNDGENHVLFISDPSRCWMSQPGVVGGIVKLVQNYRDQHGITEITALGNSMGGFAALRLPELMPIETVISFSPQFSVHPDLVPEEQRWKFHTSKITNWHFRDVGPLETSGTEYFIFHGDAESEAFHWLRFPWHTRLNHFIFRGMNHELASRMQKRRLLRQVIKHSIEGRSRVLRIAMERSRFGRRFEVLRREDYHQKYPDLSLEMLAQSRLTEDVK
ncbi:MAG: hypothetical protein LJE68_17685 [Rhodobacter sp.]|nr:hypothetical protein [Rhodobacter sp.]